MRSRMIGWLLLFAGLLTAQTQLIAELDTILGPRFGPIPNSAVQSANSLTTTNTKYTLVDQPQQSYINDSAITIVWNYNGVSVGSGFPRGFIVELSTGKNNLDFEEIAEIDNPIPDTISGGTFSSTYTIGGLLPLSIYNVRVKPVFLVAGAGFPSTVLTFTTLRSPINYWEAILPRRTSKQAFGRGFGSPLSTRPLLDEGVEVFGQRSHESSLWYSDAPTDRTNVFPSGRRGHSWTLFDGKVYMFGGRTNGYSCANTVMNTMDLGSLDSGILNYPCTVQTAEVSELWSFDVSTFVWEQLNTTSTLTPGAREQHSAVVIDNEIYVFGGKSRHRELDTVSIGSFTGIDNDITKNNPYRVQDVVYQDLWKLVLDKQVTKQFWYTQSSLPTPLTQTSRVLLSITPVPRDYYPKKPNVTYATASDVDGNLSPYVDNPRQGYCIQDVTVMVTFYHPCLSQVQMSITGPGPQSASANYFASGSNLNIRLLNAGVTNIESVDSAGSCVGGAHTFVFNDNFDNVYEDLPNPSGSDSLTHPTDVFYLKPAGQLVQFKGHSPLTNWTVIIEDTTNDNLVGTVLNYSIAFTTRKCFPVYTWVNLTNSQTALNTQPPARYGALSLVHDRSLFIFGGRDIADRPLNDLYRFDVDTQMWMQLTPAADFYSTGVYMTRTGNSAGANYVLTSWGLFRFAGYFRNPVSAVQNNGVAQRSNYDNRVYLLDPVTMQWKEIAISLFNDTPSNPQLSSLMNTPIPRYLSGAAFLPASTFNWHSQHYLAALEVAPGSSAASIDRVLFDANIFSLQANFQSSVADSLLVFGGFDGASGVLDDGSSGGLLNDLYLLRLNTLSTSASRSTKEAYRETHCRWRSTSTAVSRDRVRSCLVGTSSASAAQPCVFRDLLMLSWCQGDNQSVR